MPALAAGGADAVDDGLVVGVGDVVGGGVAGAVDAGGGGAAGDGWAADLVPGEGGGEDGVGGLGFDESGQEEEEGEGIGGGWAGHCKVL